MRKVKYIRKCLCDIFAVRIRYKSIPRISVVPISTERIDTRHEELILTTPCLRERVEYIWLVAPMDPRCRSEYTFHSSFSICLIEAWIPEIKTYR